MLELQSVSDVLFAFVCTNPYIYSCCKDVEFLEVRDRVSRVRVAGNVLNNSSIFQ